MRIALDAMGGDHAPGPIVQGAVQAVRDQPSLTVVLVGQQDRIQAELTRLSLESGTATTLSPPLTDEERERLPIVHASEIIGMEDKPVEGLRRKRDNSISKCWALMAAGDVRAVVSAGNTGAMVASGLLDAKMYLPGVRRPGIAAIIPTRQGPAVLVDVGANMNAKPEDLYQYGIMGSVYAESVLGVTDPRIGLLNVGAEEDKGNELTKGARQLFLNGPMAHRYVGHVEGRDLYEGHARVIVCEGFVGNVVLKAGEGAVEFLFSTLKEEFAKLLVALPGDTGATLRNHLAALKTRFEYQEFGGAPLLGIRGVCIICHGSSGNRAIHNALRVAFTMGEDRVNDTIVQLLEESAAFSSTASATAPRNGPDGHSHTHV